MSKYNVLVTGSGSYGVGEGIIKTISMSKYRKDVFLVGASNSDLIAYKNYLDDLYILPNANDNNYLKELKNIIELERIDIIIPGSEAEVELLAKIKDEIKDVDIWSNDIDIINIFNNKENANKFFKNNRIITPKVYSENDILEYPLILKPSRGKSSEGIYIVNNKSQFDSVTNLFKSYNEGFIVQKCIEQGEEFTVSLINLGNKVEILIMKRILNKGATQQSYIVEDKIIEDIVMTIHNLIKNEIILNIQILLKENKYYVIEINPRFSGSSPMRAMMGFNEFDIILSSKYLNKTIQYNLKQDHYAIRGYKEFIYKK